MRKYEANFILPATMTDTEVQSVADRYKSVVEAHGGKVESAGKWETRELAYEIEGHRQGTYVIMIFEADGACQHELKRQLGINDQIIRNRIFSLEDA